MPRLRRALVVMVAAIAACLVLAAPASAHLKFVSFTPSDATPLDEPPTQAVLTFSADVGDAVREASITSPVGTTTQLEPRIDGPRVLLPLPKMYSGTWTVEWSVVGPDGHPQRATRTFSIEKATAAAAQGFPADAWRATSYVGRVIFYASLLMFIGGGVFATIAARGFMPWGWGAMVGGVAFGAWLVLAAHTAIVNRSSLLDLLGPRDWIDAIASAGGRGYVLAAAAAFVAWRIGTSMLAPRAWEQRGGTAPWALIALLAIAAMSPTLSSHAMSSDLRFLRVPLDMIHLAAAAIWIGGLVQLLALTVPRRAKNPGIPDAIDVYSLAAFAAIVTLVVTGTFAAWTELDGDLGSLLSETYGRLVLVKIILLAATMPLAWANRQQHVPNVRRHGPVALPKLRSYVKYELVIAVWIIIATAALVHASPSMDHEGHASMAHGASTS